jgi:glucose-1-phosphate cytidylyltransferase
VKAVILAGGLGTRLSEETDSRPKPMVEIGGMPIIWHIMKTFADHGITDFIVCLGYKGYVIKEFFSNYFLHTSDVTIDLGINSLEILENNSEPWRITLVDTGSNTMTGGRVKRIEKYIGDDDFCLTYGDGVSDVDLTSLIRTHKASTLVATVTAVKMPGRFGALDLKNNKVEKFIEKPTDDGSWINGGYFVFSRKIFDYLINDETVLENEPLSQLASEGNLGAWKHDGFWQPMDTLRDKRVLETYWSSGKAPWVSKNAK